MGPELEFILYATFQSGDGVAAVRQSPDTRLQGPLVIASVGGVVTYVAQVIRGDGGRSSDSRFFPFNNEGAPSRCHSVYIRLTRNGAVPVCCETPRLEHAGAASLKVLDPQGPLTGCVLAQVTGRAETER